MEVMALHSGCSQSNSVRLERSEMSHRSGCLCKLPACSLEDLLQNSFALAFGGGGPPHPMHRPEDCAIVEFGEKCLLMTTDLGPLVGVDLRAAGRIAALHAMSDIHACGGVPKWSLVTLIAKHGSPEDYMECVMAGVLQASSEEGVAVLGGHTIVGEEAMVGLTVLGVPRSGLVLRKSSAETGDRILLSKSLGVGIIVRAYKLGLASDAELEEAVALMTTSNGLASEQAVKAGVHSATDVTGFGLLGHLIEMLQPGQGAVLEVDRIPLLKPARRLAEQMYHTCWTEGNLDYVESYRKMTGIRDLPRILPLLDPQTNGGLLVAAGDTATEALRKHGFHPIGRITESDSVELCGQTTVSERDRRRSTRGVRS